MSANAAAVPAPGDDAADQAISDAADDASVRTAAAATGLLLGAGVLGRVAFQHVPSVEPLVATAVVAGMYGTWRHGAFVGAAGFAATNFLVWGGQGPWTVLQVTGGAAAGLLAGFIGAGKPGPVRLAAGLVGGVAVFEAAVNLGTLAVLPWLGAATLVTAAPFALVHLASTLGFGLMLYGCDEYLTYAYRGLDAGRAGTPPGRGSGRRLPARGA